MFLTPFRVAMAAGPFIRTNTAWSTFNTATITATGGVADGNDIESWATSVGSGTLAQSTVSNRPHVETGDVDGLVMSKHAGTQHLSYTPGAPIRFLVGTIRDYGAGSPRRVLAIDTDAATDKPAFEITIEDVTS